MLFPRFGVSRCGRASSNQPVIGPASNTVRRLPQQMEFAWLNILRSIRAKCAMNRSSLIHTPGRWSPTALQRWSLWFRFLKKIYGKSFANFCQTTVPLLRVWMHKNNLNTNEPKQGLKRHIVLKFVLNM